MAWLQALDAEEGGGVTVSLKVEGNDLFIKQEQDVSSILDRNKALQASPDETRTKNMHFVASVPFIVLQMWAKDAGLKMDDPAFKEVVKRRLNDPDFKYCRTRDGRV